MEEIGLSSFLNCSFVGSLQSPLFILKVSQRQRQEEEVGIGFEEGRIHCN